MFGVLRRGVAPLMSFRQLTTVSSLAETAESLLLQTEAEGGEVGLVLDLTLGSGSDSAHLLETTPASVLGVDVDPRTDSTMARCGVRPPAQPVSPDGVMTMTQHVINILFILRSRWLTRLLHTSKMIGD